jgi:hypothetical protein
MENKLAVFLLGMSISIFSSAATIERSMTITSIGAENASAYFRVVQPLSEQCMFNVVYLDTKTATGRTQLGVLITAKTLGKNLSILAYTKDAQGMCWVNTVEFE